MNDKDIGILIGKVEGIETQLEQLSHHVYGNGREGLLQVTTRTQEDVQALSGKVDGVLDLVEANAEQIEKLTAAVETISSGGCEICKGNQKDIEELKGEPKSKITDALKDKTNVRLLVLLLVLVVLLIAASDLTEIRDFLPLIIP